MEKHKCKLCLKSFANGRALGGHMRSHMLNLYVNPNPKPPPPPSPSPSPSSSLSTVRKRSKRTRRPESSPEEVVAYCLMMLSRDKWTDEEGGEIEDELESETESVTKVKRIPVRNGYRCETCNRIFRSYQALGGHIASHKKVKVNDEYHNHNHNNRRNHQTVVEDKIHECHVCFKVFNSGQALGGHKRSHVTSKHVVKVKPSINMIDLNLPAPSDDEDDDDYYYYY